MIEDKNSVNYPTEAEIEEARKRAREKLADEIVAAEMQVAPDTPRKGPIPRKEPMYEITLDLAPTAGSKHGDLVIDDKHYQNGNTYTVSESVYQTMREMIFRGWEHQREIEGKDRNAYRREKNLNLSPKNSMRPAERMLHD